MSSQAEQLVFFETSGNQAYIYATNKLRENIGASELTYRAGTQWVLEAAGFDLRSAGLETEGSVNPNAFREWLKPGPVSGSRVEAVLATSGKALLLVPTLEMAREIVSKVTRRAAEEAPGLSITGAIVALPARDKASVYNAIKLAHERFNANRDSMPTPHQRFAMLPFCQPCATSGLPAQELDGNEVGHAAVSRAKTRAADAWFTRIRRVFRNGGEGLFIANGADQLEKDFDGLSWLGVVFSDGNGLGQIMMRFHEWIKDADYLSTYRDFSVELDVATEAAFYAACRALADMQATQGMKWGGRRLPVVPLLLGGDDLTVLVHGNYALPFTRAFLDAFEVETEKQPTLARIAKEALTAGRLSAGAGVAVVKKHFPFHSAHNLAEQLLKSAKQAKQHVLQADKNEPYPCSSLDFHILLDSTYTDLETVRHKRRVALGDERLWGGPYVTTPLEKLAGARDTTWATRHHLSTLLNQVRALNQRDDDGRLKLPSSATHALREALAQGKAVADVRLKELHRLQDQGLADLLTEGSVFYPDADTQATRFLDALSSTEFWPENT